MSLTLIKLGGSVLTDKRGQETLRREVLDRLCSELAAGITGDLVVGHGSGSFGHRAAVDHGAADGRFAPDREADACATQTAARRLHQLVAEQMLKAAVPVASLPPAGWCVDVDGTLATDLRALRAALQSGAVPLVMGDVVWRADGGARIASTEEVLLSIGSELPAARAIWVGDTDGILADDGRTLERVTASDRLRFTASSGTDVTGGMARRWHAVRELAEHGVESLLINGLRDGELGRALAGQAVSGTHVAAAAAP